MSSIFNLDIAKGKAIALAGEILLNDVFEGRVLPPLPPFPKGNDKKVASASPYDVTIVDTDEATVTASSLFGTPMCFPLSVKKRSQKENEFWLLPVEPIITIGGGNTLIKRNVAKSKLRGTIKERWNVDDYNITISGLLTKKDSRVYPKADVIRLRNICESREVIDVQCELFEIFKIGSIVIERYDIPFTKGEENQAYTISALSDDDWDLFIKLNS